MKRKIILIFTAILLITLLSTGCEKKNKVFAKQEKLIRVKTEKVSKKNLILKTTLSGKIKPFEESSIVPKIPGKVTSVNVEIGDRVKKGDILFKLDQQDMLNAVKQAEAAYNLAVANFNLTKESFENSKRNFERSKVLYKQGAISKQAFEQSKLQASDAKLEAAKASVEQARINLENAKLKLSDCIVKAPISGFITSVGINKGEMASSNMPAVTIANLDTVIIETSISEHLINKVHKGDEVDVFIKSASQKPFKGKISALSPAPTKNGLTYPIKIALDNKDALVKAGMFAEISIVSDKKENIIAIPSDAIVIKDGNEVVFLIDNNQAKEQKVSLGLDNGKYVEILKGLKEGDIIVIKGQNYLEEGNKIEIIK
ncbi:efflux RND transporter periplasmic adaptor subunit [Crassaminicella thermophila]|uniref:Efflux RND transporter periplasmic adaptor subunit n=1 Tax=Crassaminicella thermophila TaxID=2599308 RepID=A0A5C0SEY0_CRATE|nr:efflux RND transporter periplasmic adaptor subunit [Crassaminicella thermophila]QEK11798.1 efflux RND transporter periplasmic adaptor subunit [Crassaminicella thermophila]